MSLPEGSALGTLTDRELLLMVYSKVDTSRQIADRHRVSRQGPGSAEQPDPRPDGGDRRRIGGPSPAAWVAVVMKLLGGFG